ncbi:MAG: response regulator [Chloroflexi bacterium]|nr:response regulator [Chloroflexota bacterium]
MDADFRVLIADDEPDFAGALEVALAARGYQVVTARDRVAAQARISFGRPDLVVLGTLAPRGEAFLLYRWLKESKFADLPIVVIDAPQEKQLTRGWTREEGFQLESDDYLVKPLDPLPLARRIEKLLDRATRRIRVLVVDDHPLVRDGIRALLYLQTDMEVVGEAANGEEAVAEVHRLAPDVVLMDLVMPGMDGLEATRRICRECQHTRVLVLSQYSEESNVVASSRAGARGFIPKESASSQLLAAIRAAGQGKGDPALVPC